MCFLPFHRPSGCLRFPTGFRQAAEPSRSALQDLKLQKNISLFRFNIKRRAKFNLGASFGFYGRFHTSTQGRPHHSSGVKPANVIPPSSCSGLAPDEFNSAALFPNRIRGFSDPPAQPSARPPALFPQVPRWNGA